MSTDNIRLTKDEVRLVVAAIQEKFEQLPPHRLECVVGLAIREVNDRRAERAAEIRKAMNTATKGGEPADTQIAATAGPFREQVAIERVWKIRSEHEDREHNARVKALELAIQYNGDVMKDAETFFEFLSGQP